MAFQPDRGAPEHGHARRPHVVEHSADAGREVLLGHRDVHEDRRGRRRLVRAGARDSGSTSGTCKNLAEVSVNGTAARRRLEAAVPRRRQRRPEAGREQDRGEGHQPVGQSDDRRPAAERAQAVHVHSPGLLQGRLAAAAVGSAGTRARAAGPSAAPQPSKSRAPDRLQTRVTCRSRQLTSVRATSVERRRGGGSRRPRSSGLSIEQARRGPDAHEYRRREHLVEADRARSPHGCNPSRCLWVKGLGRRPAHRPARRVRVALSRQGSRDAADIYEGAPERGPKTPIEDAMYPMYSHCVFNLNPRACSIDTPLHTFVPYKHVDHLHPNAVIAVAASVNQERLCREIYGDDVIYVPWQRPGFDIGLMIERLINETPEGEGRVARSPRHELVERRRQDAATRPRSRSSIAPPAYIEAHDRGERTFGGRRVPPLPAAERQRMLAEMLPFLRGQLSVRTRFVGTVQDDDRMLRFVNSVDAPRLAALGTSCPDHFLRTKIKPLFVEWDPASARRRQRSSRHRRPGWRSTARTTRRTTNAARRPDSPAMRDPNPTVVLVPGLGMIAWGKNKSESRVTAEFYNCAIEVMRGAEAIDTLRGDGRAGGIRHRVLVARGGQAAASAAGEGARSPGRRGRRGRRGHRQGDRAPPREGRRASRLRRIATRPALRRRPRRSSRATARASAWPVPGSATAVPPIGLACDITSRESVARMFARRDAGLRRPRCGRGHGRRFRAAGQERPHRRRASGR